MEKLLLSCQNALIFRLTLAVLLGGAGLGANADFDEGFAGSINSETKTEREITLEELEEKRQGAVPDNYLRYSLTHCLS